MGLLIISYDIISSDFESPLNKIQNMMLRKYNFSTYKTQKSQKVARYLNFYSISIVTKCIFAAS